MKSRKRRMLGTFLATLTFAGLLVGESVSAASGSTARSGSASPTPIASPARATPTAADTAALNRYVPASLRRYYSGFWNWVRLGPNPYANWTPPQAPWHLCYSSAYQGNSWRVEGLKVAQEIFGQLKAKGLVKGSLTTADANNSATLQATQINDMVQEDCQVIFVMQPPSTGVCQAYANARAANVLVISMETGTDCTTDIQVDFEEYEAGAITAQWLINKLHGHGNILMCDGIPGVAASDTRQAGATATFAKAKGIKIFSINSQWTASTGKTQTAEFLATHPQTISGVWDGGTCAVPAGEAFQQAGRPLPYITGFEGGGYWLAYWKQYLKTGSIGFPQSGGQAVLVPFLVALHLLAGEKMAGNAVLYPLPTITQANFRQYYRPSMTLNSVCNAQPAGGNPLPSSYLSTLFSGGKPAVQVRSPLLQHGC